MILKKNARKLETGSKDLARHNKDIGSGIYDGMKDYLPEDQFSGYQ